MSSIILPTRGQCIQVIGSVQHCQCLWFFPPESPLLDQNICGLCGHGIHAHADYVSTVVNNYPANQCAAYVQRTPLMQFCTCEAQFCEHIGTYNSHRFSEPWKVLHYFNSDGHGPSPSVTASGYSDDANSPFASNSISFTSVDYNATIFSGNARNIPLTTGPIHSSSTSRTSYAIQPDTIPTLDYSSHGSYFTQYPNPSSFLNSPYTGPPEGGAKNGGFEYQDYGDAMYAEPREAWSGLYRSIAKRS
ncbi:uncharacterized protein ARMOST_07939 [Armillaria ostoyae]|uniref:Uncharacterized protein n=1 Tax=Armillaria ostoyae TaxID=47428 RepID=A0A284R797_ARMOS|nr:uncharacterized protein ARMOST_07939 [Armillaria ostoyae]